VVALAPSAADALVRHYRIARDRIDVSPNAVPGDAFSPPDAAQRAAARRRFGLPDDAFVAAAVGAITHEKGADLAIDAVALTPGVQLLVAGSGAERAHAQALAERTCPDRVTFLEQLDDMQPVYHAADVVLLPSRGGESMPAVLIEAALCGRPSITTDVGSITDIVEDGVTGRIIPVDDARAVADALVHLRDHRDIAAHWGVAAQERARARLTIDSVEPAWTAVLRRCAR
jgi:glycosyltransferase involved in cell wall biosynthesis